MSKVLSPKLIWQKNSPAPFESAWSVFGKLLSLNAMSPGALYSHISLPNMESNKLKFWSSAWIDFDRFGNALNIDQTRLRYGYLDQLGFFMPEDYEENVEGIKLCGECIKSGYHCILFQLGFVKHCPWHRQQLRTPCYSCKDSVFKNGLRKIKNPEWLGWQSLCGHVSFNDGKVPLSNSLSEAEEFEINESCIQFMDWWGKVSNCKDVWKFLSKPRFYRMDLTHLPKYLSAAESIAGICPWYIETPRDEIRTLSWKQPQSTKLKKDDGATQDDTALRKSELDIAYRSIRRYIFSRFVRPHRSCWNELSNYKYFNAQRLNSDTACTVAMAYAAWRLSIEDFLNIEVFKLGKFFDKPILLYRIQNDQYIDTFVGQVALLYAHFFSIWEKIQNLAGTDKFTVARSRLKGNASEFAASYNFEEWLVIIPNYKSLQVKSFVECTGQLKKYRWMINPEYFDAESLEWNVNSGFNNNLIFVVDKDKRGLYKRVNV